jgi:hypothetical protein
MSIDPLAEELLTFAEAAKRLPRLRAGRPINPSTLWRWTRSGARGISAEALTRFLGKLNELPSPPAPKRKRDHDELVEETLAAKGV